MLIPTKSEARPLIGAMSSGWFEKVFEVVFFWCVVDVCFDDVVDDWITGPVVLIAEACPAEVCPALFWLWRLLLWGPLIRPAPENFKEFLDDSDSVLGLDLPVLSVITFCIKIDLDLDLSWGLDA